MRAVPVVAVLALLAAACGAPATPVAEPASESQREAPPAPPPTPSPAGEPDPEPAVPDFAALEPASDPGRLAGQLTLVELAIRDADTPADALAGAGRLQQRATLMLIKQPELREAVLGLLPDDIRSAVAANIEAGEALRSMVTPREELPDWQIVAPVSADALLAYYREAEEVFEIPWYYLAAIHLVETRMGRIRGTSVAGAQGPMQFMPATWDAYGEGDVNDNRDAILAAGRYLRASGAPADMARALFAYNRSDRYVRAVTLYAEQMRADARAYHGYYHWQVYYVTVDGDVLLEEGFGA